MKNTGIRRCVDDTGRIVLPKELRTSMGIGIDEPLEIYVDGDCILLKKVRAEATCALCGKDAAEGAAIGDKRVCPACLAQLKAL